MTVSPEDLVFTNRTASPLQRSDLHRSVWKPLLRRAGLPEGIRFHSLRHTSVTLALAAGVPVRVAHQRLGHAGAAMTLDVYGHVLGGYDREAAVRLEKPARGRGSGAGVNANHRCSSGHTERRDAPVSSCRARNSSGRTCSSSR
jgi:hypothetical protein